MQLWNLETVWSTVHQDHELFSRQTQIGFANLTSPQGLMLEKTYRDKRRQQQPSTFKHTQRNVIKYYPAWDDIVSSHCQKKFNESSKRGNTVKQVYLSRNCRWYLFSVTGSSLPLSQSIPPSATLCWALTQHFNTLYLTQHFNTLDPMLPLAAPRPGPLTETSESTRITN